MRYYKASLNPDIVILVDTVSGESTGIHNGTPEWATYQSWLAAGNTLYPDDYPMPPTATRDYVLSMITDTLSKVSMRHQMVDAILGAGGVAVVDLASLGYADFEVLPQVTITGSTLANMRLITGTASAKNISGTNRKITITGRRIKAVTGVTDLVSGLWENAATGDVVSLLVFEKPVAS